METKARFNWLRIVGCILVAIGFLWLVAVQFTIRPMSAAVFSKQLTSLEQNETYTSSEVRERVFSATNELADRIPTILFPAIIMLAGAMLLDKSARNSGSPNQPPSTE